jgi:alpha-beta hydrolase superfamily lysophospholipase
LLRPSKKLLASCALAACIGLVALGVPAWAFVHELRGFRVAARSSDTVSASQRLPGLKAFEQATPHGTVATWYVPGSNMAAVIVTHGYGGARQDMLPEITLLSKSGFSVLAFDWPGQGESAGRVTLGAPERSVVSQAVDWLLRRGEVDPSKIGLFGFSAGGYLAGQSALVDSRIRALALAGTMSSFAAFTDAEYAHWGPVAQWAARYADKVHGLDLDELRLDREIQRLRCPLLVIVGGKDPVVPPDDAKVNFIRAHEPKELVFIADAAHGDYAQVAPSLYEEKLVGFFRRALLDEATRTREQ